MAAANESQGLKIAVAVFVTLAVLMAVSLYFSYKAYTETEARLAKANSDLSTAKAAADLATRDVEGLRKDIGVRADDSEAVKTEIKNAYKKNDDAVKSMIDMVNTSVTQAQGAGASGPELEDLKGKVDQIASSYRGEVNKNYISALERLTDLVKNLALLNTRMGLNYVDVKRGLEGADGVNAQKLAVVEKALADAKTDLEAEAKKHVDEREILLTKVDTFTTENAKQASEIASANAKLRQLEDDYSKKLNLAQQMIKEYRDQTERKETILERPDGRITFVDYTRGEVHCNVTRSSGARPQMIFSIFDSGSAGLPTDKPKGTIELVSVGDSQSIARIVKTNRNIDPIRTDDIVYSAAWSPNEPMRFALIGKIDINLDGKDDRADLKRMIAASGGIVDYDLPPPYAGKETGKLTGRDAWYVIDERLTLRQRYTNVPLMTMNEEADFSKKKSDAIKEARSVGVRPMLLERLLPYLGYDFAAPIPGRAEASDPDALRRLLAPKPDANKPKPAATDAAAPPADAAAPAAEGMPKEEPK